MQVSAFVDGELPENEAELLVRRLSQDADLRRQVSEYLAIGRVMRGEYALPGSTALRERIAAELEERPLQDVADRSPTDQPSRYFRPLAGVAIAATVALVAIFGLGRVADVDSSLTPSAVVAEEVVSETVPRMTEEQMELFRAHGEDSDSFFLRMTSLEMWADELPEDSASAEDEGEDETREESDGAEPVTSQP